MRLVLYSKPGCHLCEGLQEKLEQVRSPRIELEIRDITTRSDWFNAYQYEIPVLVWLKEPPHSDESGIESETTILLPRLSPRASVQQVEQMLQRSLLENSKNTSE
jgi:hypothetical protein